MANSNQSSSGIDPTLVNIVSLVVGDCHGRDQHTETYSIRANKTMAEINKSHGMASKLYDFYLTEECAVYEDDHFSEDFRTRARDAFHNRPDIANMPCLKAFKDDGYTYDNCVESETFVTLYLEIAKLVDPDLRWIFKDTSDYETSIGGFGLFCDD